MTRIASVNFLRKTEIILKLFYDWFVQRSPKLQVMYLCKILTRVVKLHYFLFSHLIRFCKSSKVSLWLTHLVNSWCPFSLFEAFKLHPCIVQWAQTRMYRFRVRINRCIFGLFGLTRRFFILSFWKRPGESF